MEPTLTKDGNISVMEAEIEALLRKHPYRLRNMYHRWSMYDTLNDDATWTVENWQVRYPDFSTPFAAGKVRFTARESHQATRSPVFTNPTWGDVAVAAELSCRARGAPECDHIFMEGVELVGQDGKISVYSLHFGS